MDGVHAEPAGIYAPNAQFLSQLLMPLSTAYRNTANAPLAMNFTLSLPDVVDGEAEMGVEEGCIVVRWGSQTMTAFTLDQSSFTGRGKR